MLVISRIGKTEFGDRNGNKKIGLGPNRKSFAYGL
jgi:hypothetical protein